MALRKKACALIYDEIESLFRKVAAKTHAKGWWQTAMDGTSILLHGRASSMIE